MDEALSPDPAATDNGAKLLERVARKNSSEFVPPKAEAKRKVNKELDTMKFGPRERQRPLNPPRLRDQTEHRQAAASADVEHVVVAVHTRHRAHIARERNTCSIGDASI